MYADRVSKRDYRYVLRADTIARRFQPIIAEDIEAWRTAYGFDLRTDCGGRWYPALRSPYVRLEACQTRWHERAGHIVYGALTPEGAPLSWPVTRAGFRAAVAWCEAANAELPVRPAVPCRRMRLR